MADVNTIGCFRDLNTARQLRQSRTQQAASRLNSEEQVRERIRAQAVKQTVSVGKAQPFDWTTSQLGVVPLAMRA